VNVLPDGALTKLAARETFEGEVSSLAFSFVWGNMGLTKWHWDWEPVFGSSGFPIRFSTVTFTAMFVDEIKSMRARHGGKGGRVYSRGLPAQEDRQANARAGGGVIGGEAGLNNLIKVFMATTHRGRRYHGMGEEMTGLAGKDLIIKVHAARSLMENTRRKPVETQ
jgi:hypothetical protein